MSNSRINDPTKRLTGASLREEIKFHRYRDLYKRRIEGQNEKSLLRKLHVCCGKNSLNHQILDKSGCFTDELKNDNYLTYKLEKDGGIQTSFLATPQNKKHISQFQRIAADPSSEKISRMYTSTVVQSNYKTLESPEDPARQDVATEPKRKRKKIMVSLKQSKPNTNKSLPVQIGNASLRKSISLGLIRK